MKPDQELFDVIEYERSRVMTNKAWQSDQSRIYTLLELATRLRQMEISNLGGHLPVWETILGSLISWHHELPVASGPMAHDDAHEIIAAALRFTRLDNLQLSTRMGLYRVRKTGNDFVLKPRWNPAIEVADLFLEASAEAVEPSGPSDIERQWVANRANTSRKFPPIRHLDGPGGSPRHLGCWWPRKSRCSPHTGTTGRRP